MPQVIYGTEAPRLLRNIAAVATLDCLEVKAAIAYAAHNKQDFFEACADAGKFVTFYGRYDHSVPVDPRILKWFLAKGETVACCKLVPDILHAKVIWWVGYGAYIGSANLTERAWSTNIEAGTFFTEEELDQTLMLDDLRAFFDRCDSRSARLTPAVLKEMELWSAKRQPIESDDERLRQKFESERLIPRGRGLHEPEPKTAAEAGWAEFQARWNESLQTMLTIAKVVSLPENRPTWIDATAAPGAQADQLVHAYYYKQVVGPNNSHPFDEFFQRHRLDKKAALDRALAWWKASEFDYWHEQRTLNEWAPRLRELLAKDRLPSLAKTDFVEAMSMVHAVIDYGKKRRNADLGMPPERQDEDLKVARHCELLWETRSSSGVTPIQTLNRVVWGTGPVERRVWDAVRDPHWRIPGIGFSTLGEVVGWARPDESPPRNDRTIKGLRALGFDVKSV